MALKNKEHKSCTGLRCSRILMDKVHKTGTVPTIPKISELWGLRDSKKLLRFLGILGLCRFVKMIHYIYIYIHIIYSSQSLRCSMFYEGEHQNLCTVSSIFFARCENEESDSCFAFFKHVGLRHDLNI